MAHYRKKETPPVVPSVVQTPTIEPRGLRVAEVAAYTGTTICFIRSAIHDKKLPAMLVGKRHIVLREDADAFLTALRASVKT